MQTDQALPSKQKQTTLLLQTLSMTFHFLRAFLMLVGLNKVFTVREHNSMHRDRILVHIEMLINFDVTLLYCDRQSYPWPLVGDIILWYLESLAYPISILDLWKEYRPLKCGHWYKENWTKKKIRLNIFWKINSIFGLYLVLKNVGEKFQNYFYCTLFFNGPSGCAYFTGSFYASYWFWFFINFFSDRPRPSTLA